MDIERPKDIQQRSPVTNLVTSRDIHNNSVNNTVMCSSLSNRMKHEAANLELHVNEDKTYIGDNVKKHDSPET